jgi:hypothetical protein
MSHRLALLVALLVACHKAEPRVELDEFLRSEGHRQIVKLADDIQASSERGDCATALAKAAELSALIDRLVPPARMMMGRVQLPPPQPSAELIDYYMALRLDASVDLARYSEIKATDPQACADLAAGVSGIRGVRKYRPGTVDEVAREHR